MSEVINLAKGNGDDHVYEAAANILCDIIKKDYSYVIQVWNDEIPETKYPKILISTSDEAHGIPAQIDNPDIVHIFKQYAPMSNMRNPSSVLHINKVTPIPLCHLNGVIAQNRPILDRELDWCWMGQFDPYRRLEFRGDINRLSRLPDIKYHSLWYEGWNNGVSKEEYSNVINNSKIVFAPTGSASLETFRFFEGMMCGCFVIGVQQPNIYFYNTAPYMPVRSWDNIIEYTQYALNNHELLEKFSKEAVDWYNRYCSPEGLASYMMEALYV